MTRLMKKMILPILLLLLANVWIIGIGPGGVL
jgi:hypothetical protein